jgi:hypothetical protein
MIATATKQAGAEVRTVATNEDVLDLLRDMLDQTRLPHGARLSLQITIEGGARYHFLNRTFATVKG